MDFANANANTKMIPRNIEKEMDLKASVFAKLEFMNPAGSAKDRVAKYMIKDAEEKGLIKENAVITEVEAKTEKKPAAKKKTAAKKTTKKAEEAAE